MRAGKILRDACVGLAVAAVGFGGLEAGLRLFGVGADASRPTLSRGFDPTRAYLVPDPGVPGGFRTQFNDPKIPDRPIPPKGDARRVLLLGGSNTEAFPATWLQQRLNELRRDEGRFEVINLGRPGYGSERVTVILMQALELLDPDVCIVYSGHNEFVERGFEIDLERAWGAPWLARLAETAGRSRVVSLLARAFTPPARTGGEPEDWTWEYGKFRGLAYEETLRYYAAYRQNLVRMCRAASSRGVHTVLCTVVHNRLAMPFESSWPASLEPARRAALETLLAEARAHYPACFEPLLPPDEEARLHLFDWGRPRDVFPDPPQLPPLPGRRPCSGPLAEQEPLLRENRDGWPPKVMALFSALERVFAGRFDDTERAGLERAETLLEEVLAAQPDHPRALFELGLVRLALGRSGSEVLGPLEDAGRFDRAPRKGNIVTNECVRDAARECGEALLVDADALFASRMPMGLVGWEWMDDHCHLNGGARLVLMDDLARAILERWY